jgi:hypothetical protein
MVAPSILTAVLDGEHLRVKGGPHREEVDQVPELSAYDKYLARFCPQCSCGCPALYVDQTAPAERRLIMTDDFGQRIHMSVEQLQEIIAQAQDGALTRALHSITGP